MSKTVDSEVGPVETRGVSGPGWDLYLAPG